jgi:hypothetical protein
LLPLGQLAAQRALSRAVRAPAPAPSEVCRQALCSARLSPAAPTTFAKAVARRAKPCAEIANAGNDCRFETVDQIRALRPSYSPAEFIAKSPTLESVIQLLDSDFFCLGDRHRYASVVEQLRIHDPYMVCADFEPYLAAESRAATLYRDDPHDWARRSLYNVAGAGAFSSDATIQAYAEEIWGIQPQPMLPRSGHP